MAAKVPNLRYYRELFGLSRKQLADLLPGISVNEGQLYSYERENGGNEPPLETLVVLADFFGTTTDELLGRPSTYAAKKTICPLRLERFGERIQAQRERLGLSRAEVARSAGITPAYLSMVEKGKKIPLAATILSILNALQMSADSAFMDSLIAAQEEKASYLHSNITQLAPEKRLIVLRYLELLIQSLE